METIVGIIVVVVVGLMVGVEFSVAAFVNPIFDRLPGDSGVGARSDGARVLGRVMPFWYIGSVVLAAWWAALEWGRGTGWEVLAAAVLLIGSVLMSVTLLVPINSRVATWSADGAPKDWRAQVGRWDRLHYARIAIIVAAFVLLVSSGAV